MQLRTTLEPMYRSVDTTGLIIDCNYKYARMLGYIKDEAIGMSIYDHTPKEQHNLIKSIFHRWTKRVPINNSKFSLLTKSGQTFDVLVTIDVVLDEAGKVTRSNTTLFDYEELKQLQNMVKLSKYESLYENSPDMYRTVNVEGVILDCNLAYEKKIGYTKAEIIGKNLIEHTGDRSVSPMLINMARWRVSGACKPVDVYLKKKDGTEFPVTVTPTNLYDDDGALLGRNVIIQDKTEMQKTKDLLDERIEIERLKDEFLTGITHELKTPLTPIIGFSQALARPGMLGTLNEKQASAVKTIMNNAIQLRQLVMDLLDIHKLELGRMKFNNKKIDIEDMLGQVRSSVEYAARDKDIELVLNVNATGTIIGDQHRISEILTNLLYNAIDFTPAKTGKVEIYVAWKDKYLYFQVKDNGVGIPPEKQSELFNKFYQISTSVTRSHGGTGLGLSICKGLVEGMGGTIGVNSTPGKGSTFHFTILPKDEES